MTQIASRGLKATGAICITTSYLTKQSHAAASSAPDDQLLPVLRAGPAIVSSQQLEIQNIDHPIVVQIRRPRGGRIVVHPNRQGIKLIDHIVAIQIACQQRDARLRAGTSRRDRG